MGNRLTDSKNYLNLSTSAKKRKDNELAKQMMDYYDYMGSDDADKIEKFNENYDLHAGRWRQIENVSPAVEFALQGENVILGGGKLRHYPIADRVSKSVVGDIIMNPLISVVVDNSAKGRNERERAQLDRVREYFFNKEIKPRVDQILAPIYEQYGASLPPEEMQQAQQQATQQAYEQTPDEIIQAMERYRTPEQMIFQAFLDYSVGRVKAKEKFDTGGEHAVVTAEEYYRLRILNGEPDLEVLNPKYVTWGGSENVEFCEDGVFIKYVTYLTPEDLISKYGMVLSTKDIKRLADLYAPIPGYYGDKGKAREEREAPIERRLVEAVADNPQLAQGLDIRTREGQNRLMQLYASMDLSHRDGFGIRETYITWKWTRKAKVVRRKNPETGEIDELIRSEHYFKNPMAGDLEVKEILIPQAWHGVKLGEMNDFYLNVEPLPFQYSSDQNPFNVKLSIYGGKDNTFMNNTRNASLIDLSKPWQYRFNVLMKKLEEYEATDYGKVLLASVNMIPENWSVAQWLNTLIKGKIGFVANHNEGTIAQDHNIFKSEDMSNTADIAASLQKLEYFEKKVYSSMYYNPVKAGNISPYATNQNVIQSSQAADRQMLKFHNRRRMVKERVLLALLNLTLIAYKDNDFKKSVILDDGLRAYFDLNYEYFEPSELGLYVVDDYRETEKLEAMKNLALTLMQNGAKPRDLSAILNADSMAEIDDILYKSEMNMQKEQKLAHDRQMELNQQQSEMRQKELEWVEGMKDLRQQRSDQVKLAMAKENSMQLANANDINQNQVNDSLEKALLQIKSDEEKHAREYRFKEKELERLYRFKEKELREMLSLGKEKIRKEKRRG